MVRQVILLVDVNLRSTFAKLENVFNIKINQAEVNRIFHDYENAPVSSSKTYTFYKETFLLIPTWKITGIVDEHEPETIFLMSQGGFGRRKTVPKFFKRYV